jgi:hypothetical protein
MRRPSGDNRSAGQIFKDTPLLKGILKHDGPFASNKPAIGAQPSVPPTQQNDQHVQGLGQFGRVSPGAEAQRLKAFSEIGI